MSEVKRETLENLSCFFIEQIYDLRKEIKRLNKEIEQLKRDVAQIAGKAIKPIVTQKQRIIVFVDCENISVRKVDKLLEQVKKKGNIVKSRAYDMSSDKGYKKWLEVSKQCCLKLIRIGGKRKKDRVDNEIKREMTEILTGNEEFDAICIMSGDGGFSDLMKFARKMGKTTIAASDNYISDKLKKSCDLIIQV